MNEIDRTVDLSAEEKRIQGTLCKEFQRTCSNKNLPYENASKLAILVAKEQSKPEQPSSQMLKARVYSALWASYLGERFDQEQESLTAWTNANYPGKQHYQLLIATIEEALGETKARLFECKYSQALNLGEISKETGISSSVASSELKKIRTWIFAHPELIQDRLAGVSRAKTSLGRLLEMLDNSESVGPEQVQSVLDHDFFALERWIKLEFKVKVLASLSGLLGERAEPIDEELFNRASDYTCTILSSLTTENFYAFTENGLRAYIAASLVSGVSPDRLKPDQELELFQSYLSGRHHTMAKAFKRIYLEGAPPAQAAKELGTSASKLLLFIQPLPHLVEQYRAKT